MMGRNWKRKKNERIKKVKKEKNEYAAIQIRLNQGQSKTTKDCLAPIFQVDKSYLLTSHKNQHDEA